MIGFAPRRLVGLLALLLLGCGDDNSGRPKPRQQCTDDGLTQTIVTPNITVVAPNAFSPNGDGFNDTFVVRATYTGSGASPLFGTQQFAIYKHGSTASQDMLYGITDSQWRFDGRDIYGRDLPEGPYTYVVKLDNNTITGTVTIVRSSKYCNCRSVDLNDPNLPANCP